VLFRSHFEPLMRTRVIEAIKNVAPNYTLTQFLQARELIELAMMTQCSQTLDTVFADVRGFQLQTVTMPAEVVARKLASAIQAETNDKEFYLQQASVIQAQTAYDVQVIRNQAMFVSEQAVATAQLIITQAQSEALEILETARSQGLEQLFVGLHVTQPKHKASLDYLLSLMTSHNNATALVDFSQANVFIKG